MFTADPTIALFHEPSQTFEKEGTRDESELAGGFAEENWTLLDCDSGRGSSLKTTSEISDDKPERDSPSDYPDTSSISISKPPSTISEGTVARTGQKKASLQLLGINLKWCAFLPSNIICQRYSFIEQQRVSD
jgi:hypothetical protein